MVDLIEREKLSIDPHLVRRTGGGWLAIAPIGAIFPIGVTHMTKEGAVDKFCSVYNRWIEIQRLDIPS